MVAKLRQVTGVGDNRGGGAFLAGEVGLELLQSRFEANRFRQTIHTTGYFSL